MRPPRFIERDRATRFQLTLRINSRPCLTLARANGSTTCAVEDNIERRTAVSLFCNCVVAPFRRLTVDRNVLLEKRWTLFSMSLWVVLSSKIAGHTATSIAAFPFLRPAACQTVLFLSVKSLEPPVGIFVGGRIFNARKTRFPVRPENTDRFRETALCRSAPLNTPSIATPPIPLLFILIPRAFRRAKGPSTFLYVFDDIRFHDKFFVPVPRTSSSLFALHNRYNSLGVATFPHPERAKFHWLSPRRSRQLRHIMECDPYHDEKGGARSKSTEVAAQGMGGAELYRGELNKNHAN